MLGDTKQFWFAFISHWQMGVCAFFLIKNRLWTSHITFCILLFLKRLTYVSPLNLYQVLFCGSIE